MIVFRMDEPRPPVLLTRLRLENVRGFRDAEVPLAAEGGPGTPRLTTLVIGKNGTNKSTLLRAIALCLADPTEASTLLSQPIGGIVPSGVVRSGAGGATIELAVVNGGGGRVPPLSRRVGTSGDKDVVLGAPGPGLPV